MFSVLGGVEKKYTKDHIMGVTFSILMYVDVVCRYYMCMLYVRHISIPHQQSSCFVIAVEYSRDNKNYESMKIRLIEDLL